MLAVSDAAPASPPPGPPPGAAPPAPTGAAALATAQPCRGRAQLAGACAALLAAAVFAAFGATDDARPLVYPDAYDYAQMGRQLARGEGFSSLQAFPFALAWLEREGEATAPPWPNVWRFPLPVVSRALAFSVGGVSDAVAHFPALLFSILTAPLCFLLGNRLAGPVAGLVAAGVWIASPSQVQFAASALSEPGATLLAVAIALVALRVRDTAAARDVALLGALFGLAWLQRSNLLALAPAALWWVASASRERRAARFASCIAVALAVASAWWLRNAVAFGDPLLNLTTQRGLLRLGSGADPFFALTMPDEVPGLFGAYARAFAAASLDGAVAWLRDAVPSMLGADFRWALVAALVAWPFALVRRQPAARLFACAASGIAFTALVFAPIYPDVLRFYWPFAPLLATACIAVGCSALAGASAARSPLALPAGGAVALLAFVLVTPRGDTAPLLAGLPAEEYRGLEAHLSQDGGNGVIVSDRAYAIAWQLDRPAVRFSEALFAPGAPSLVAIGAVHFASPLPGQQLPLDVPPLSHVYERVDLPPELGRLYLRRGD